MSLAAVTQYGWALKDASPALKGDLWVVLAAVTRYGWSLQYASAALHDNDWLQHVRIHIHGCECHSCRLFLARNKHVHV
jgi:hypothetical protein